VSKSMVKSRALAPTRFQRADEVQPGSLERHKYHLNIKNFYLNFEILPHSDGLSTILQPVIVCPGTC
jgi:hypothetical protein